MSDHGATLGHKRLGILGGGQLGRMLGYKAHQLGIHVTCLDPKGFKSPAGQVIDCIEGSFNDEESIRKLAQVCDVLTVEIEHVDTTTLEAIEKEGEKTVEPSPATIRLIQDKYVQKVHLQKHDIPLPDFKEIPNVESILAIGLEWGYPMMLKSKRNAYDGKGNAVVKTQEGAADAFKQLGGHIGNGLYIEKWCPFVKEIAVMVVRGVNEIKCYPVVETVQLNNVCHTVLAPAQISDKAREVADMICEKAIASLPGRGVYGVELFVLDDDSVLLNEIAPRPHNSGHYTIEACEIDQFEQHMRAVMGLPLGSTCMKVGAAMMINCLGTGDDEEAEAEVKSMMTMKALNTTGCSIHWYGKGKPTKGRKMGHVTIVAPTYEELMERVQPFM